MNISFQNISLKWRWRLLFTAMILLFAAAYNFNIKKTSQLIAAYHVLKESYDTIPEHFENIVITEQPQTQMSKIGTEWHLLSYLARYCDSNEVHIREIAQTYSSGKDSIVVETNKIVLEGEYQYILQLIFNIEKEEKINAISSANWELTKDRATGICSLLCVLYIKRIIYEK